MIWCNSWIMFYEVDSVNLGDLPKKTWSEVVEKDC